MRGRGWCWRRIPWGRHLMPSGWSGGGWSTGGRWGMPTISSERTAAALARGERGPGVGTHLPPDEVDEMRIVAAYLASHPDTPQLVLDPAPGAGDLMGFVAGALD